MSQAFWMTSKRIGKCSGCDSDIQIGERIVWNPIERKAYCKECGIEITGNDPQGKAEI